MELSKDVLNAFSIKAKHIRKYKGIYIIETNTDVYKVRTLTIPENKVLESQKIIKYLKNDNLKTTDEYKLSESGKPFYFFRNEMYVVSKYLPLQKNNFAKKDDMIKTTQFLSKFHNSVKTTDIDIYPQKNIIDLYKDNLKNLKNIKKTISKQNNYSEFDLNFIKSIPKYLDLIEETIEIIDTNYFKEKLLQNISKKTISHSNIKEENFEIYKGEIYVNNFTKIDISDQLLDLSFLIQRHLKVKENDELIFHDILNEYSKINTLSHEDVEILKAFVKYPKRYVKTVLTYYSKNRNFTPTGLNNKLNDEISRLDKNLGFFEM